MSITALGDAVHQEGWSLSPQRTRGLSVVRSWRDSSRGSQQGSLVSSEGLTGTASLEKFSCAILPGREPDNRACHPLNSGCLTLPISLQRLPYTKTHQALCVCISLSPKAGFAFRVFRKGINEIIPRRVMSFILQSRNCSTSS